MSRLAANIKCRYFSLKFEFDFRKNVPKAEKPIKRKTEEFYYLLNFVDILLTFCLESGRNNVAG